MKKLLSILITAAIACTLTACGNDGEGQVSEETVAVAEMKTIEPPEDSWTLEQLFDVTYLYNKKVTLPCTIGDLKSLFNYEYNDIDYLVDDENNIISLTLFRNDNSVATAVINGCASIEDISLDSVVERLFFAEFLDSEVINELYINGVTLNDDKNVIIQKLGVPNASAENYIEYHDKDTGKQLLRINFDDENKVLGILFISE